MLWFVGRRLLYLVPVLLAVSLLTFLIASLLPGDLAYVILGDQATPEKVEALRLMNCAVNRTRGEAAAEMMIYPVDVIRSKVSPAELRRDDLDNKLLEMGLCSACASNAAELYLKKPESRCAKLTKRALEGNPDAIKTLQGFPDYCTAWK